MAEKWSVPLGSNLCSLLSRPIPPCIPHGLQEDRDMGGGMERSYSFCWSIGNCISRPSGLGYQLCTARRALGEEIRFD